MEVLQELQPTDAVTLITAQFSFEVGRLLRGRNPGEVFELVPQLRELCIEVDQRLGCEQCVEQPDLMRLESQVLPLDCAESREQAVLLKPLFRDDAERPVIQPHGAVAARHRKQFRKRNSPTAEVCLAMQLEPVDVRLHAELELSRLPNLPAIRFHSPAFRHQFANGRPQLASQDFDVVRTAPFIDQAFESRSDQLRPGDLLQLSIANQTASRLPLDNCSLRAAGSNQRAGVIKLDLALEPLLLPARTARRVNQNRRHRNDANFFELEVLWQVQLWSVWHVKQSIDQLFFFAVGDREWWIAPQ